jgi:hypothetical protein
MIVRAGVSGCAVRRAGSRKGKVLRALVILAAGVCVAAVVYVATGGRLIVLPILVLLPIGLVSWRRR